MTWHFLVFDRQDEHPVVPHIVHVDLKEETIEDLIARDCVLTKEREIQQWSIDMPGAVFQNRPVEEFIFRGCRVQIPSEDIETFFSAIQERPVRTFANGKTYVKMHAFMRALVLSLEDRDAFVEMLDERRVQAGERADAFSASLPWRASQERPVSK